MKLVIFTLFFCLKFALGDCIVLDPGHGGDDFGAVNKCYKETSRSACKTVMEKDLNLEMSLRLKKNLEDLGHTIVMTRSTDVFIPLDDRVAFARNSACEFFVSVHHNSADVVSAEGFEAFYNTAEGNLFVSALHDIWKDYMISPDRGVKKANYRVLNSFNSPSDAAEILRSFERLSSGFTRNPHLKAILLEPFFVQNPAELKRYLQSDYVEKGLTHAIHKAVLAPYPKFN